MKDDLCSSENMKQLGLTEGIKINTGWARKGPKEIEYRI